MNLQKFFCSMSAILLFAANANGAPGDDCDTSEDCDDGERCRRNVCVQKKSSQKPQSGVQQPSGVSGGAICCDQFGNSRCVIGNAPQPIGSGCFCYGQGYGAVCR